MSERPGNGPSGAARRREVPAAVWAGAGVVALWAFFLVVSLAGIDFGGHWDEQLLLTSTGRALRTGSLRPLFYIHGSVMHWLVWLPGLPALLERLPDAGACLKQAADHENLMPWAPCYEALTRGATEALEPGKLVRQARSLFAGATSLAVLFTGLAAWRRRGDLVEACLSATVVAVSWELQYHSRWMAPDGLLVAVAAATMWLLIEAERRGGAGAIGARRWENAAVVAAALGMAVKPTGGILLMPVLHFAATRPFAGAASPWRRLLPRVDLGRAARLTGLFAVAFCLFCPGILTDTLQIVIEVWSERVHYQLGHGIHTESPGPLLLGRELAYVLGGMLSTQRALGFVLGAFAIAGAATVWRESRALRLLLGWSGAFLIYLAAQRVMFARNLLWLGPLVAVCAARGVGEARRRWSPRLPRSLAFMPVAAAAAVLGWSALSTWEMSGRVPLHGADSPARAVAVLQARQGTRLFVTPRAAELLRAADPRVAIPSVTRPEDSDYAVALLSELSIDAVHANRPGTFALGLDAPEVNLDYYPSWGGRERIVAVRPALYGAALLPAPAPAPP